MKKSLCLLLAGCLACVHLSGCSGKNQVVNYQDTDLPVTTITFFGNKYEPENVRVIEEIITGFMEENPNLRISYESLKGAEYFEALRKRMASGKGNDVFMVNHDVLLELERSGQVADLSGLESIGRYSDAMLSQMEIEDGAVYVCCSPVKEIHFVTYPPRGAARYAGENMMTGDRYELKGSEAYVRVECVDAFGNTAWTNPAFAEGLGGRGDE